MLKSNLNFWGPSRQAEHCPDKYCIVQYNTLDALCTHYHLRQRGGRITWTMGWGRERVSLGCLLLGSAPSDESIVQSPMHSAIVFALLRWWETRPGAVPHCIYSIAQTRPGMLSITPPEITASNFTS